VTTAPSDAVRVGTWNTQWATPRSARGQAVAAAVAGLRCEVIVATETTRGILPADGHVVDAGTDWGYRLPDPARRKVAMWSANPWRDIDAIGDPQLPGGRFVAATTDTALGPLRVVGLCIPWRSAHVSTGRRDRATWEDHLAFLRALPAVLVTQPHPLVVAGDFNQRVPHPGKPTAAAITLTDAFRDLAIVTNGDTSHGPLIDHIAIDPSLEASEPEVLGKQGADCQLSDHHGVAVELQLRGLVRLHR
jgi:endonuclease/exonuclease/phosphatase family metal-dependent hydrolase